MPTIRLVLSMAFMLMAAVLAATTWGINKSQERTECYRHAKAVTDCEQPGPAEQLLRRLVLS